MLAQTWSSTVALATLGEPEPQAQSGQGAGRGQAVGTVRAGCRVRAGCGMWAGCGVRAAAALSRRPRSPAVNRSCCSVYSAWVSLYFLRFLLPCAAFPSPQHH